MNNVYYVYIHRRGDNNEVFYVGKGKGNRAYNTVGRNNYWKNIYKKCGRKVELVEVDISEQSAFDLEMELIKFYRESGHTLANLTNGGEGASGCVRSEESTDKQKATLLHHKKFKILLDHDMNEFDEENYNGLIYYISSSMELTPNRDMYRDPALSEKYLSWVKSAAGRRHFNSWWDCKYEPWQQSDSAWLEGYYNYRLTGVW
jgi:hypothetical protein